MVSIRLQRVGRKRQAQFRVVVQDSHFVPTSGRVIANLGFYNPHTKEHGVDLKKASVYLSNGAQPSARMVRFFVDQKVGLPVWVKKPTQRLKKVKNPDKLRCNRPAEAVTQEEAPKKSETVEEQAKVATEAVITDEEQKENKIAVAKDNSKDETETKAEETINDNDEAGDDEKPQSEEDNDEAGDDEKPQSEEDNDEAGDDEKPQSEEDKGDDDDEGTNQSPVGEQIKSEEGE